MLKKKLAEQPILELPYLNTLFWVYCDASGNAIGDFLNQEGKPIAYFSEI